METIKVNMTPCEDVQTIHASQNDSEAREWGFELHNNGDVIDSSEVTDQMVFKAYKGGTEQILPENTSTPTTSPFLGDIRYPQGLLTDQEFTYRQSPTESDGLAKITDIKGNTLVWNQLVNYTRATQTVIGVTYTNNNDGSCSINGTTSATSLYQITNADISIIQGHKYLLKGANGGSSNCRLDVRTSQGTVLNESINIGTDKLFTASVTSNSMMMIRVGNETTVNNIKFVPQLFDLTQMGLDSITSADEFKALFPLPFYQFEQGKLLSFNSNGIKTVSKNQFDTQVVTTSYAGLTLTKTQGTIRAVYSGGSQYAGFNFYGSPLFTDTFLKSKYRLSFDVKGLDTQWTVGLRRGASFLGGGRALAISNDGHYSFTIDTEANPNCYLSFARTGNKTTAYDVTFSNIQLELGTTETSYEPYTSSTLSLPISTYFPTGMKSAGNVYDELTESKAITRVGSRAYQSGDESDTSVITDGTTTYYALATPTETSFTTASLVTENAEIPLSNEDGVLLGKCTEQLSENPGFIDAKIKLSDADGECYSNKLQLHIERSPQ